MNKAEIITDLFENEELQEIVRSLASNVLRLYPEDEIEHLSNDLVSEIFLELCEKSDTEILSMHNEGYLFGYAVSMAKRKLKHNRTPFQKKFLNPTKNKSNDSEDFLNELESQSSIHLQVLEVMKKEIDCLHPHRRKILEGKAEGLTFQEIGNCMPEKTNRKYIGKAFKETKKKLKKRINKLTSLIDHEPVPTLSKSIRPDPKIERYYQKENFSEPIIVKKNDS